MKVTVKHRVKPNGANELGFGKEYSLETSQVVNIPEPLTKEFWEFVSKALAVAIAPHIRAAAGNSESVKGKKVNSFISPADWATVVDAWTGRELTFDAATASPANTSTLAQAQRDASELYAKMISLGLDAADAAKLCRETFGVEPTKAEIVG